MNISEELIFFIKSGLVDENVTVTADTPFESLGLDSFSIIEIILFIERKFGITLPDKELNKSNLFSASTLARCVQDHLKV